MNGTKKWYESKLVGMNILLSLIGIASLLSEWFASGDVSPAGVSLLVGGVLGVVLRVWFTDTAIG